MPLSINIRLIERTKVQINDLLTYSLNNIKYGHSFVFGKRKRIILGIKNKENIAWIKGLNVYLSQLKCLTMQIPTDTY